MTAGDLTTIERVQAGWRVMDDPSQVRTFAETLIGAASRLLRQEMHRRWPAASSIDDRITAATLDADLVSDQVAAAVIRVLRNPDGLREYSVDDYREVRDSALSAGLLQFLDSELELLSPQEQEAGAFTVRPGARAAHYALPPFGSPW